MEINYAMTVLRKYISPAWRAGDFKNLNVFLKAWTRSENNPEICAKFFLNSENAGDGVAGNNFIIVFVSVDGVRIKVTSLLLIMQKSNIMTWGDTFKSHFLTNF